MSDVTNTCPPLLHYNDTLCHVVDNGDGTETTTLVEPISVHDPSTGEKTGMLYYVAGTDTVWDGDPTALEKCCCKAPTVQVFEPGETLPDGAQAVTVTLTDGSQVLVEPGGTFPSNMAGSVIVDPQGKSAFAYQGAPLTSNGDGTLSIGGKSFGSRDYNVEASIGRMFADSGALITSTTPTDTRYAGPTITVKTEFPDETIQLWVKYQALSQIDAAQNGAVIFRGQALVDGTGDYIDVSAADVISDPLYDWDFNGHAAVTIAEPGEHVINFSLLLQANTLLAGEQVSVNQYYGGAHWSSLELLP